MSKEHFIKNIEIKNFKCFEDFKAEGFGRVNLIGGKNNVGKTAFMEACFLASHMPDDNFPFGSRDDIHQTEFAYTILEFHRNASDFLLENENINFKFAKSKFLLNQEKREYQDTFSVTSNDSKIMITKNHSFISMIDIFNQQIINFIFDIKLLNKEDELNLLLHQIFNIDKVDVIRDRVMFKSNGKYLQLSEFGDGVKHFLNILLALYLNKNDILYLDEIESGIHYSNYDKLWKIILTISKEQNVQVFATTHSKECIESYARVAKKLKDNEITFTELGKNKHNQIKAIVMDNERFFKELEVGNEVRGW